MRPRTRSIRFKIFTLSFVPLLVLAGLWGYAASVTVGDAVGQRHWRVLNRGIATPTQDLSRELARERMLSVTFLRHRDAAGRTTLDDQRARTDPALAAFREKVLAPDTRAACPPATRRYADEAVRRLARLSGIRGGVDADDVDRIEALTSYNDVLESLSRLFGGFSARGDIEVYRGTQAIALANRGLDMMGRESALLAAADADDRLTDSERDMFTDYAHVRRYLMGEARAQLADAGFRARYDRVFAAPAYQDLDRLEQRILTDSRSGGRLPGETGEWRPAAEALAASLDRAALESRRELGRRSERLARQDLIRLALVGGLGFLLVVVSGVLSVRLGRRIGRELIDLRGAARRLAEVRLPRVVDSLRRGADVDMSAEAPPLEVGKIAEVADVAESFSMVQQTAIAAAVGQAETQKGVSQIFLSLARRNQSLLHRQLSMLDALESRAEPDLLEDLFRLDHLTTRMRRHAEGLIILSGATPGRGWREPVRIVDVLRGAAAEVEDYPRVAVLTTAQDAITGSAVADVIHLFAELMDNATSFSPPNTEVHVMTQTVGTGLVVEIEDRGLGMTEAARDEINRRLEKPPEVDVADTDRLGLFVVGRLAERHGVTVSLRRSPYGGTTAIVLLPHDIVVSRDDLPPGSVEPGDGRADVVAATETTAGIGADTTAGRPVLRGAVRLRQGSAASGPRDGGTERRPARPAGRSPEPPAASDSVLATGPSTGPSIDPAAGAADLYGGLPRRIRQQSLVPQLRAEPPAADEDLGTAAVPSPEWTRALVTSMRDGRRRARAEAETNDETFDSEGPP